MIEVARHQSRAPAASLRDGLRPLLTVPVRCARRVPDRVATIDVERSTADNAPTAVDLQTHGRSANDKPVPRLAFPVRCCGSWILAGGGLGSSPRLPEVGGALIIFGFVINKEPIAKLGEVVRMIKSMIDVSRLVRVGLVVAGVIGSSSPTLEP
jgi:hypothetical protein